MDPSLASLVISPRASHLRDERTRADVAARIHAALRERGVREIVTVEAGTPAAVRDAAADALGRGSSVVVIAGGDGTLRDATGALAGSGTPIGIVPCGTGNLYASAIGVPRRISSAIEAIAAGSPRPFDAGEVRVVRPGETAADALREPFIVACGTGLDARLIAATDQEAKRRIGIAAYFLAATRLLPHLRPRPTVLTIDGVRTELESIVVLVANCGEAIPGRLGPRFPIDPADGLLHVFVLQKGGLIHGIRGALELMAAQGAGVSASGAGLRRVGREVRVEVTPAQPTQVDGDPFPAASLEARVRPGALLVLEAPPGTGGS